MFGPVVGQISGARAPLDTILALVDSVPDPIKAHVHGFGPGLLYGVIGDPVGSGVVSDELCRSLWPAEFCECGANRDSMFAVDEETPEFSFGGRGDDML